MELIVTSRVEIEAGLLVRERHVVISIRDPGKRKAKIGRNPSRLDVLYQAFHDAEPTTGMKLPPEIRLMTQRQARRIREFVEQYWDRIGAIVCHCEQGMSRSPAIAAAIAEKWNLPTESFLPWTQPNQFVYQLVQEAFAEPV